MAGFVEHLDAVVRGVDDIHAPGGVDCDPGRVVQAPVARAEPAERRRYRSRSGESSTMRLLPVSATNTLPDGARAMDCGMVELRRAP